MPYISPPRREVYSQLKHQIKQTRLDSVGEMTYLFDLIADIYMSQHTFDYLHLAQVVGAFECAKSEFLRKMVNDYEDLKEVQSGTIWKEWDK